MPRPTCRRLAFAVALSCPLAAQAPDRPAALGPALDRALQLDQGGRFWGAVAVARGGEELLAKGYGFADYRDRPITADTRFEIASVSKQFTAVAVLRLVQKGRLQLDATLGDLFAAVPADKAAITVHQLLTHTAGLSPRAGVPYAWRGDRAAYVARILGEPLATAPGAAFAYANVGYALLAAIVEEVTGGSFEDWSRVEVFAAAGLRDTGFVGDEALQDPARSTVRLGDPNLRVAADWSWGWGYRGMGGVVSTARDLLRWNRALRRGALLEDATLAAFLQVAKDDYACGVFVAATERGTRRVHHSGSVAGYRAWLVNLLDEDADVVVLTNDQCDPRAVAQVLEQTLLPSPALTLTIDTGPYEVGNHRSCELGDAARLRVAVVDGGFAIALVDGARDDHEAARLVVPKHRAAKVQAQLEAAIRGARADGVEAVEAGLYLSVYPADARTLELGDGLELNVMPRYRGMGEGGKPVVDERVTFVVVDSARGIWPVMVKLGPRAAAQLLEDVDRARAAVEAAAPRAR
ncbi:MAG: serine hydrolase domain-containing protein [Planctomycetota bacterium]